MRYKKLYKQAQEEILELKKELAEARQLENVLRIIAEKTGIPKPPDDNKFTFLNSDGSWSLLNYAEEVAVYVDDYLGGKVIKQEATKIIAISKEGVVTEGLTAANPDEGFNYKLIRE